MRKIGIIGAGHVGSHGGYALISQGLAEEIVYIDIDEKRLLHRLWIFRTVRPTLDAQFM